MKKALITLLLILVLAAASAYYYFSGKEYVYQFTESQLQNELDERLPHTRSYFYIFEVTLDNPRVSLSNGSNRVRVGLDIVLNVQAGGEPRPLRGRIDVSAGVKYVSSTGQFFLTDPIIENLDVQGVPQKYLASARNTMTVALAEYYSTHPIYSLKETDVKQAATKLVLKNVIVKDHILVLTLGV